MAIKPLSFDRLTIRIHDGEKEGLLIQAHYNPKEYSVSKSVPLNPQTSSGNDSPETQFTTGQGASMELELFFDTYEQGTTVRVMTKMLDLLTVIDASIHRPPRITVTWGADSNFEQTIWAVESLNKRFTMFLADGTPVRATCKLSLRETLESEAQEQARPKESPDHAKIRSVRRGETLQSIAEQEYDNAGEWRRIADANHVDDPFRIEPGTRLIIPPILR